MILKDQGGPAASYLDAREILKQYASGDAPACLPTGVFRARHFGPDLDAETLENHFDSSGVVLLKVEVVKYGDQPDFIYVLMREAHAQPETGGPQ